MRILAALTLLLCACTFEWNGETPSLPLLGSPPPLSSFHKLNDAPAGRASLLIGGDGVPWTAFCAFWSMGNGNNPRNCRRMQLVRLGPPGDAPSSELIEGDSFGVHYRMLYVLHEDMSMPMPSMRTVTLHRPGDAADADVDFVLPGGRASYVINDGGDAGVFLYWVQDQTTTEWTIQRRDQAYQRHIPIPSSVDPSKNDDQLNMALDGDGGVLVVRTPDGVATAYSTTDERTVPLGARPRDFFIDNDRRAAVFVGMDGIHAVTLAEGTVDEITASPVEMSSVAANSDDLYYATPAGLWRAPLDRSSPAQLIQPGAARVRAVGPNGEVVYSHDPSTRFTGGAGDGWLGDWAFMERGRQLRFSADGQRLHFLEHSATLSTYGDLTLATSPAKPNVTLAINVHAWDELADGRLVAIENAVQPGTWNRMVLIDEQAMTRTWFVPSATDFFLVPGKQELIVDTVSGASGYDILRVPAP